MTQKPDGFIGFLFFASFLLKPGHGFILQTINHSKKVTHDGVIATKNQHFTIGGNLKIEKSCMAFRHKNTSNALVTEHFPIDGDVFQTDSLPRIDDRDKCFAKNILTVDWFLTPTEGFVMKMWLVASGIFLMMVASGCGNPAPTSPPGAMGPGGKPSPPLPPRAVSAAKLFAVPPESWGEADQIAGNQSFKIETPVGKVFLTIYHPGLDSEKQVSRFQSLIEPSSAVNSEELTVGEMPITKVKGQGTRLTFKGSDFTEVASRYPNEAIIGYVFGKGRCELAILVDGKQAAIAAFAPELETWVQSFH